MVSYNRDSDEQEATFYRSHIYSIHYLPRSSHLPGLGHLIDAPNSWHLIRVRLEPTPSGVTFTLTEEMYTLTRGTVLSCPTMTTRQSDVYWLQSCRSSSFL